MEPPVVSRRLPVSNFTSEPNSPRQLNWRGYLFRLCREIQSKPASKRGGFRDLSRNDEVPPGIMQYVGTMVRLKRLLTQHREEEIMGLLEISVVLACASAFGFYIADPLE